MTKQQEQKPITGTYSQLFDIAEKKRKEAALKQKGSQKKKESPREKEVAVSPSPSKAKVVEKPKPKPKKVEKKERQLNAWISATQNETLDQLYFRLRARGVKIKKGELVGVAIEVISRILEKKSPRNIDSSILDSFVSDYRNKET